MDSSRHLDRAQHLLAQNRDDLAEEEARNAVEREPNNPMAHYFLCMALLGQSKNKLALQSAETALSLAPDFSLMHSAKGKALFQLDQVKEAKSCFENAIPLDPDDADNYGMLAWTLIRLSRWQEALEKAEIGLTHNPDNVNCTNARAHALVKLKRRDEASSTLDAALARNPDNPHTHAQKGWALLERGKPDEALEHFKEALRLDPTLDHAREGVLEAIKAKNVIYAFLLKYFFFMARLSPKVQFGVLIGGYFAFRISEGTFERLGYPAISTGITILWLSLVLLTWTGYSFFNLLLRIHPLGRHALSDKQRTESNLVGLCLLATVIFIVLAFVPGISGAYLLLAMPSAFLLIPLSTTFRLKRPSNLKQAILFTSIAALLVLACAAIIPFGLEEQAASLSINILLGIGIFSWYANILFAREF